MNREIKIREKCSNQTEGRHFCKIVFEIVHPILIDGYLCSYYLTIKVVLMCILSNFIYKLLWSVVLILN